MTAMKNNAIEELSSKLLEQIADEGENPVVSPSCLYQALTLMAGVTDRRTKAELQDALGGDSGLSDILPQVRHIYPTGDTCDDFKYQTQNSVWLDRSVQVNPMFDPSAAGEGEELCHVVEMGSEEAKEQTGKWLSAHTGGLFSDGIDTKPDMKLIAMGAMYLKDAWVNEFYVDNADEDWDEDFVDHSFTLEDGTEKEITFVSGYEDLDLLERDGSLTLAKELTSGCRLIASMPAKTMSLGEYVRDGHAWKNILAYIHGSRTSEDQNYWLHMPKMELSSEGIDMNSLVIGLGIADLFTPLADFSPISLEPLMVEQVLQSTKLEVDEKGLEGASYVRMIAFAGAALFDAPEPREIFLDRPFVVVVVSPQGIPLFVGVLTDPK